MAPKPKGKGKKAAVHADALEKQLVVSLERLPTPKLKAKGKKPVSALKEVSNKEPTRSNPTRGCKTDVDYKDSAAVPLQKGRGRSKKEVAASDASGEESEEEEKPVKSKKKTEAKKAARTPVKSLKTTKRKTKA